MNSSGTRSLVLFLGIGAVLAAVVLALPVDTAAWFFSDDAYYYFQVARNLSLGLGSTFDGLNSTNGYHPLWMLAVRPIFAMGLDKPMACLKVVLSLQVILAGITCWLCWLYTSKRYGRAAAAAAVIFLCNALYTALLFNGLESGLLVCLLFGLLVMDVQWGVTGPEASLGKRLLAGVLWGAVFLTRLDSAFVLVAFAGVRLAARPRGATWGGHLTRTVVRHLPMALAFSLLAGLYFAHNLGQFGHLTPISGALKSTFPAPVFHFPLRAAPYTALLVVALFACRGIGGDDGGPGDRSHGQLLVSLWLGCLLHLVWSVLFMSWGVFQWHFALYAPVETIGVAALFSRCRLRFGRRWRGGAALAAVALFTACSLCAYVWAKGDHHAQRIAAARWAREHTAPDALFAMHDAGAFAYFSQRRTINLDGVINSYAFQERIRLGTLERYFDEVGVDFVADAFVKPGDLRLRKPVVHRLGLAGREGSGYRMLVEPVSEVYVSRPGPWTRRFITVVWRYEDIRMERFEAGQ